MVLACSGLHRRCAGFLRGFFVPCFLPNPYSAVSLLVNTGDFRSLFRRYPTRRSAIGSSQALSSRAVARSKKGSKSRVAVTTGNAVCILSFLLLYGRHVTAPPRLWMTRSSIAGSVLHTCRASATVYGFESAHTIPPCACPGETTIYRSRGTSNLRLPADGRGAIQLPYYPPSRVSSGQRAVTSMAVETPGFT